MSQHITLTFMVVDPTGSTAKGVVAEAAETLKEVMSWHESKDIYANLTVTSFDPDEEDDVEEVTDAAEEATDEEVEDRDFGTGQWLGQFRFPKPDPRSDPEA